MTSSAIFTIDGAGSCTDADCGSLVAGDYTVTGTYDSVIDTATLHVTPAALDHFELIAPANSTAGDIFSVTVTAVDQYGNVKTGFSGTVHFTSTDPSATLPADYTFLSGDAGTHTFDGLALVTAGSRDITATGSGRSGTATIEVAAAGLATIAISPTDATIQAGQTQPYTSEMLDAFGNSLGDATPDSVFSIDGHGSCLDNTCGSDVAGDYTVTVTYGDLTDTSTLHVDAAGIFRIVAATT